jgi:hypothetical protein
MLLYHTSKLSILASIELFNVDSVYSQWYSSIMLQRGSLQIVQPKVAKHYPQCPIRTAWSNLVQCESNPVFSLDGYIIFKI